MEIIVKYKAIDGVEFDSAAECLKYEVLIKRVDSIMDLLPKKPKYDYDDFIGGSGFIQHKKEDIISARLQILEICKEYIDHHWIQQAIDDDETIDTYGVIRLLSEYNLRPLVNAWYRICCVDKLYREWGQPFFANNPGKGDQIQLN